MENILDKNKKEEAQTDYGYYSKLLKKPFETLDELITAETEYKEAKAKEEAAVIAKRKEASIVNSAIDAYEEGKVVCSEAIKAAYNEYKEKVAQAERDLAVLEKDGSEKLNKWLAEHPGQGFHYTYKSKDGKITKDYKYYAKRHDVFDNYGKFAELLKELWF